MLGTRQYEFEMQRTRHVPSLKERAELAKRTWTLTQIRAEASAKHSKMDTVFDAVQYLQRIGLDTAPPPTVDGLALLQRAHLSHVPFENLDIVAGVEVRTDLAHSFDKVVNRERGGWCFELNGAFGALLEELGFAVVRLGAAVLLDGPNAIVDHLALEVTVDQTPYLVDVGFGDSFATPLELNATGPQDGLVGTFEFIASSQGLTLTRHDDQGVPEAQYRFKRTVRELGDFEEASARLQRDRSLHWSQKPFASRLVDGGPERITLLRDRLKKHGPAGQTVEPVAASEWDDLLLEHFSMRRTS